MKDELSALREEVARLRERVAVLEARPQVPSEHLRIGPISPGHGAPWPPVIHPATVPPGSPYQAGDARGWWLHGPTASA